MLHSELLNFNKETLAEKISVLRGCCFILKHCFGVVVLLVFFFFFPGEISIKRQVEKM